MRERLGRSCPAPISGQELGRGMRAIGMGKMQYTCTNYFACWCQRGGVGAAVLGRMGE